ncbi:MAG: hypothetical protein U0572_16840 [Phycisphaerales bacterium]
MRYSAQLLYSPCNSVIGGRSINSDGLVAGSYSCDFATTRHAFVWDGRIVSTLPPVPGYPIMFAWGVNSAGDVVGELQPVDGIPTVAFLYAERVVTSLGTLPGGNYSRALAINESGLICGQWGNNVLGNPGTHGFVWDGEMHDLILSGGPSHTANDINARGAVCGWMGYAIWNDSTAYIHQPDGVTIDLGKPAGAWAAEAKALNDVGDACGKKRLALMTGGQPYFALLWSQGATIELGALPGYTWSDANDLSNDRVVVGICVHPSPGFSQSAFVWRDGVMTDLNDLLEPGAGVTVTVANAINDAGQITGAGSNAQGDSVAVLLTPVPPLLGDLTCDWEVGADDLALLLGAWGACPPSEGWPNVTPCPADLDEDGDVDASDLAILLGNWSV